MKKIAVILSGCGHRDGSEITEAVSTLIALSQSGAHIEIFAPDLDHPSLNHLTGERGSPRAVRVESARIARGKVRSCRELKAQDFDGLALPGGFGAATVLCRFGEQGAKCEVLPDMERILKEFYQEEKPIAAVCIAPALVARVLGQHGITLTVGAPSETSKEVEKTGALHEACAVEDYVTDREHRIISTPAYMQADARPDQVFLGIQRAMKELVEMA